MAEALGSRLVIASPYQAGPSLLTGTRAFTARGGRTPTQPETQNGDGREDAPPPPRITAPLLLTVANATPQVPYGCPSAFERRFSAAFPDLYAALVPEANEGKLREEGEEELQGGSRWHKVANGHRTLPFPCHFESASLSPFRPHHTAPNPPNRRTLTPPGRSTLPQVSWVDVQYWMWPLFTEQWGPWRAERLGLAPLPLTAGPEGLPLLPLPQAPLLLFGEAVLP